MQSNITRLRRIVRTYYRTHGRHTLPWRQTHDPYRILVSEVMLQQTQVPRVIPKYKEFLRAFPTIRALAAAPLRDVLVLWQGLGYNRRAKQLHDTAKAVCAHHKGNMPRTYEALQKLPGVGPYTAGAVCVFAYNMPIPLIETNIRTVLFHHLLPHRTQVPDSELLALSRDLCPRNNPREWYAAMMDYGSYLKEQGVRLNVKSKQYVKQSRFEGSTRQIRGQILRALAEHGVMTERALLSKTKAAPERVRTQLKKLRTEGLVKTRANVHTLP